MAAIQRDTTQVTLNTPVSINLGPDRSVCSEVILDAGSFPGGTYDWGGGVTAQTLEVTASGTYTGKCDRPEWLYGKCFRHDFDRRRSGGRSGCRSILL